MTTIGYILLILFLITATSVRWNKPKESKPDPPKICTLKLNDANNTTSYISGPNVNE
jgi:hypothetical protein